MSRVFPPICFLGVMIEAGILCLTLIWGLLKMVQVHQGCSCTGGASLFTSNEAKSHSAHHLLQYTKGWKQKRQRE